MGIKCNSWVQFSRTMTSGNFKNYFLLFSRLQLHFKRTGIVIRPLCPQPDLQTQKPPWPWMTLPWMTTLKNTHSIWSQAVCKVQESISQTLFVPCKTINVLCQTFTPQRVCLKCRVEHKVSFLLDFNLDKIHLWCQ